jgi:pimeloyl-ACP methyl ester carboxylesterase
MRTGERVVEANGVPLCLATVGDPADPAILLVHGACASLLWWDRDLCERLAAGGRYVIRYDNRDTGRSISYPPGRPGYTLRDLAGDAIGLLDVLGIERAHVVGRSMAGAIALILGVGHPDRVASLTFVGTTPGDDGLPPMSPDFLAATADPPDPADRPAVVRYIVALMRAYAGGSPHFDEPATRAVAEHDVARTANLAAALTNHFLIDTSGPAAGGYADLTAPALIVHGDRDPVYPLPHGRALQAAIPDAELLVLPDTGHDLPRPLHDRIVAALLRHTRR